MEVIKGNEHLWSAMRAQHSTSVFSNTDQVVKLAQGHRASERRGSDVGCVLCGSSWSVAPFSHMV